VASTGSGGAVYVVSGSLIMVDSVMSSNYASYGGCIGGGDLSVVSLTRVAISNNSGHMGGGYYTSSSTASLSMSDCTLAINSASTGYGGGIDISATMTFYLTRCIFVHNSADLDGGALRVGFGATGTLLDCTFRGNRAKRYGGAVAILTSTTTVAFQGYEFVSNYDFSGSYKDIYREDSATLTFANSCPLGYYNFGYGWLECSNCESSFTAAVLHGDDCKSSTGTFLKITTQYDLEEAFMINRTLMLGADIQLTDTIYMFRVASQAALTGLVVDGGGQYSVDGGDSVRCFLVYGTGMNVAFRNLTISNGFVSTFSKYSNYGAAVYVGEFSALRMSSVTITSCRTASTGWGGAVYVESSSLVMVDSVMSSNYASYGGCIGGGAFSTVSLTRVSIFNNTASHGGGYYTSSSSAVLSMTECTLRKNSVSAGYGGGIGISAAITFSLTRCTFDGNYARYDGGSIRVGGGATGTLVDCIFRSNRVNHYGGAIHVYTSTTRLSFLGYEFDGNYDSSGSHGDIFREDSASLHFADSCPEGWFNFGSSWLKCLNCATSFIPAVRHGDDCKSLTPTSSPSPLPTSVPSLLPTPVPTLSPTPLPSPVPSPLPTPVPSLSPTSLPSPAPSSLPTPVPSIMPTPVPSLEPSPFPSPVPSIIPSPVDDKFGLTCLYSG